MGGGTGKVYISAELWADVSAQNFWKQITTTIFDVIIVNLDVGSYLNMIHKKAPAKAEKYKKDKSFRLYCMVEVPSPQWSTLIMEYLA